MMNVEVFTVNRPDFTRAAALALAIGVAACGGDGPTDPPGGGGNGTTLEIAPSALLFAAPGDQQQLTAYAVDEDGNRSAVTATFESSNPATVAVTTDGLATGGPGLGSSHIVARSGDLVSAPLLALRATPAPGALLVADDDIRGEIEPVDPAAPYEPGWRYRIRLRGVTPSVGQIVLASGGASVGGRVVSVAGGGDDVQVVLELVPIGEMFAELEINERLPLEHAPLSLPAAKLHGLRLERTQSGGIRLRAPGGGVRFTAGPARRVLGAAVEQEFDLGSFTCKAEVPPGFVFPLTLDVASVELNPSLALDLVITSAALQRLVVRGSIAPRLNANPLVTAALEAKAECKDEIAVVILPIGGPLSLILGGQVPLGVGFEIGTKATFGQLGFDLFLESSIATEFGIECLGTCSVVGTIESGDPDGYFKPVIPEVSSDLRFELGASVFGWGELAIGNRYLEALRFKTVELKAGLEQKMELATMAAQADDPAYASSFSLKPVVEAKAAANLDPIANLLRINLATFTFAPELPTLAQSPRGTFTIEPATVEAGDDTELGDLATFNVTLSDVNYLGAYAVENVEIRWLRTEEGETSLGPGRPGCTDLEAAQGQVTFTCQTDFLSEHMGEQAFYAFVNARVWGVPVPVPLEIAVDARATVNVVRTGSTLLTLTGVRTMAMARTYEAPQCEARDDFAPADPVLGRESPLMTCASGDPSSTATARSGFTVSTAAGNAMTISASGSGRLIGSHAGEHHAHVVVHFTVAEQPVRFTITGTLTASIEPPSLSYGDPVVELVSSIGTPSGSFISTSHSFIRVRVGDLDETLQMTHTGELPPGQYIYAATLQGRAANSAGEFDVTVELAP